MSCAYKVTSTKMLILCDDLVQIIGQYLFDRQKIYLGMCCKHTLRFHDLFYYYTKIDVKKICKLQYFDRFTNVEISTPNFLCPMSAKHVVYMSNPRNDRLQSMSDPERNNLFAVPPTFLLVSRIPNNLPSTIRAVTLGDRFNQSIKGIIPPNVTHLTFGYDFDVAIDKDDIPSSVTDLVLGYKYNHDIRGIIPASVKYLAFGALFNRRILSGDIPSSVETLTLGGCSNNVLPHGIKQLVFGGLINQPISEPLPTTITHLTFGEEFNVALNGCIPPFVTHLTFGCRFNKSIHDKLPATVTHLFFGYCFNQPLNMSIPQSVTHLNFGDKFNQSIVDEIPSSVIFIHFGKYFNHSINQLPQSVTRIQLYESTYRQLINDEMRNSINIDWY